MLTTTAWLQRLVRPGIHMKYVDDVMEIEEKRMKGRSK
jgi:hypothetical protein